MLIAGVPERRDHESIRRVDPDPPESDRIAAAWPAPLTRLVGRDREIDALLTLLGDDTIRLVTLTGPGGVGKTRLALQVASRIRDTQPIGVEFVALAPIEDRELVPAAIARALDIRESGERSLPEQLHLSLRDWAGLLILDNFEQVVEAAPLVTDLLMSCPRIKVVVTSRAVLHLSGEHEFAVPPLALPTGPPSVADAARSDAVALFLQRAQAMRPSFALTQENVAAIVEICRRLDGLPLALELAAARIKVLAPAALLSRLSHRLQLLTSGPLDQPARLQTMRAAITWSHDLLTGKEQGLFRRLTVFAGGFTLEAAEAVCGSREEDDGLPDSRLPTPDSVFEGVASLLDKSLLQQAEGLDGEQRFAMLETVREFGLEQLDGLGEAGAIRELHAAWCLDLVDDAWHAWVHRDDIDRAIHRLEREHDNLRAALAHLKQQRADDRVVRLAGGLYWFWLTRGYVREGRDWLVHALEAGNQAASLIRARALIGAGALAHYLGDEARAGPFLRQGLADARALGDSWLTSQALIDLAIDEADEGHYDRANPLFDDAVAETRASGDRIGFAQALSHRGLFGWASGEGSTAEALIHEALAVQRAVGDTWGVSHSLAFLGLIACERGDGIGAASYVEESLNTRVAMGALQYLPWSLENVALVASATRRWLEAARLFGAAANLRERIGSPGHEPEKSAYLRAIERARVALGGSAFAAEWATGRTCSIDESIAEARAVMASRSSVDVPPRPAADASAFGLTERELDVLRLLVDGQSDREIGDTLFISFRTAQKHVANIFVKLGVGSRTAAVTTALRAGLVPTDAALID